MELIIICVTAFAAALLTFFSGFGLGTLLTPVFMLFFPVNMAIALTGIVHFFNNLFKLFLVGKNANRDVVLRFGIPAVVAALVGSSLLLQFNQLSTLVTYAAFGHRYNVYPVKLIISILLICFALLDLIPSFGRLQFDKSKLPIGGLLSGFFGGLSGNQGALRSAFLIKAGLSKEAFIGTAVVVSVFVDITRLSVYASGFVQEGISQHAGMIACATLAAIAGAVVGNNLLKKVTLNFLQVSVAIMLIAISVLVGAGII